MAEDYYRQYIPEAHISIEQNTENVPADGKFYLLHDGQVLESFTSLKKAQERFKRLKEEIGFAPEKEPEAVAERNNADKELVQRILDAQTSYWVSSYRRPRGGNRKRRKR